MEEQKEQEFTLREKMDAYVKLGMYRQANTIAEKLKIKIQIQDSKGTQYSIASDGSIRRAVPKRKRK